MSERRTASAFHVPSLDGIRTLAFTMVFLAHAGLDRIIPGGFGVTVFFFLSGYLITTLLRVEYDASGTVDLRQFYLRRTLRILPPFYLVLALACVAAAVGLLPGKISVGAVGAELSHWANYWIVSHGYAGMPSGTGVYWSLAVEEHFYLFFPLLYLALRRNVRSPASQARALWAACAVVLAWRCFLVYRLGVPSDRTYVATDTRVDSILFGCALAVHRNPMLDGASRIADRVWKWVLLPLSALALGFTFVYRDPAFRESFRYTLQGVALGPLFVVAMRFPTWAPMRVLNAAPIAFAGVLSYSLYLVHHVVLDALEPLAGTGIVRAILAMGISVALAWLIHRFVEKPCARLRRELAKRFARPTAAVAEAS